MKLKSKIKMIEMLMLVLFFIGCMTFMILFKNKKDEGFNYSYDSSKIDEVKYYVADDFSTTTETKKVSQFQGMKKCNEYVCLEVLKAEYVQETDMAYFKVNIVSKKDFNSFSISLLDENKKELLYLTYDDLNLKENSSILKECEFYGDEILNVRDITFEMESDVNG